MQECLDAFTETETLEEEEGYNCQACKRKGVCATKKLTLYRSPPVLVLHLKRFNANSGTLGIFSRFSAMSKVRLTQPGSCNCSASGTAAVVHLHRPFRIWLCIYTHTEGSRVDRQQRCCCRCTAGTSVCFVESKQPALLAV